MEECTYRWVLQQSVLNEVLENIYILYNKRHADGKISISCAWTYNFRLLNILLIFIASYTWHVFSYDSHKLIWKWWHHHFSISQRPTCIIAGYVSVNVQLQRGGGRSSYLYIWQIMSFWKKILNDIKQYKNSFKFTMKFGLHNNWNWSWVFIQN